MKRKNLLLYIIYAYLLICINYFFGLSDYLLSENFDNFDYPLNVNIKEIVDDVMAGKMSAIPAINYYPYSFLTNSSKCSSEKNLNVLIVVRSAMHHFSRRNAIRRTYGQDDIDFTVVRTLFFLGVDDNIESDLQEKIDEEIDEYNDIIQMDFIDSYYNNTIKTMMSFKWIYEHCSTADFYLFTDDDMYISVRKLLDYVQSDEIEESTIQSTDTDSSEYLYAGYVFESYPQRFRTSKWRVSLHEYRWDKWPPYVATNAYVLCNKALKVMYIASFFVEQFRFDDIYLGIIAKKVGIVPTHCPEFHYYKKEYNRYDYRSVIVSHGYGEHCELIRVWNEQNNVT